MYRNAYQRGMLTIFFSVGSKPLAIWETRMQDGYITRFLDQDIKSMVLEIGGTNVSTTYITCPKGNGVLGITMPFLVMIVKNLKKYFSFEVTILDETGTRRRFRVSNFQSTTQILPLCTVMPIGLSDGWNQIQFNLAEFTRRAYKKQFVEVQKLKINANIRLRRVYFTERLIPEDELPAEYKLFFPLASKKKQGKENKPTSQQAIKPITSAKLEAKTDEAKSSKTSVHSLTKVPSQEDKSEDKHNLEKKVSQVETEGPVEKVPSGKQIADEDKPKTAGAESTLGEEQEGEKVEEYAAEPETKPEEAEGAPQEKPGEPVAAETAPE
ncbi:unnamed protein product [Leptosia nina]|uniref:CFA20 domain-containing protein n=1 Tax=Leptosia nina TaxID=320188 RepID=A0AAV1JW04_9NEOP